MVRDRRKVHGTKDKEHGRLSGIRLSAPAPAASTTVPRPILLLALRTDDAELDEDVLDHENFDGDPTRYALLNASHSLRRQNHR